MSYEAFRLMVQGWASSGYLPEALAYGFVVNALLAGLLMATATGLAVASNYYAQPLLHTIAQQLGLSMGSEIGRAHV